MYPESIALQQRKVLVIRWSDGQQMQYPAGLLRRECPCAHCLEKREPTPGQLPILQPEETVQVEITGVQPVGNYAYNIQFSDGHTTGIYTLEYLRRLGGREEAGQG